LSSPVIIERLYSKIMKIQVLTLLAVPLLHACAEIEGWNYALFP
jgi:hypothetical protein